MKHTSKEEMMGTRVNAGNAYGRKPGTFNKDWTLVGAGNPMGELLRRYWHPVGLASDASATPKPVRVLGEDLILFRDGAGRAGLIYSRCLHRGTTLYYAKVEDRGIRCCYHGWLFDVQGNCLEQPCEPEGGRFRHKFHQPWYPVQERYGLIFAYMGPPDRKPILPRYRCLEEMATGEFVESDGLSIGGGGPIVIPCNWFQHFDNIPDVYHVYVLHSTFTGIQFVEQMSIMPEVSWALTDRGIKTVSVRTLDDGRIFRRVSEAVLPTLRIIPNPFVKEYGRPVESIGWVLPIDDTHFMIYTAARVREPGEWTRYRGRWENTTEQERRAHPGDYEAQVGQGPITFHSEEHLATSDRGVILLRRLFQKQVNIVAGGGDPIGVIFDEDAAMIDFEAGNFIDPL